MNVFDIIALLVMVGLAIAASAAEPRLSSRTVKIKYGTLRGSLVNFPNKSLKTVEVFLGKCQSGQKWPLDNSLLPKRYSICLASGGKTSLHATGDARTLARYP